MTGFVVPPPENQPEDKPVETWPGWWEVDRVDTPDLGTGVPTGLKPVRCPSTVLKRDDRWGGFRSGCELPAEHPGPHVESFDACEPKAWLSWVDPPVDDAARAAVGGQG